MLAPVAASLALAIPAGSQEVRVEVVKHADGEPIHGALIAVMPERASPPVGRFSGRDGRAALPTPPRGGYRVRVEKVGYDTWTSVVLVPSRSPTRVRAGMKLRSLRLPPLTGSSETRCSSLGEQASVVGDMWGEIRKALSANSFTESQGLAPLEIERYDRFVDANGIKLSEQNERHRGNAIRPYNVIELQQTAPGAPPRQAFRIPEASTLLSDEFIADHCFTGIRGTGAETGLLGLEFKPAKLATTPDLSGVLWLDPTTYSLRHLVFEYVNVPASQRAGRPTGRVEYQQLSGGEWIVTRWQLRVPRGSDDSASRLSTSRGYREIGGVARSTGSAVIAAVPSPPTAESPEGTRVSGTVVDGTTGAPLAGVSVSTVSGSHRTTTNRGGGYEMWMSGAVSDSVVFDHPRLRLFRVPQVRAVSVPSGGRAQVSVVVPSYVALRQALCSESGSRAQPGGMAIGYVRDEAGNPVPNATVSASWQVLWVEEKGRLVSTNERRFTEAQTAADGSYLLCGFRRDTPVTFKVAVRATTRLEEQLPVPRHMVVERDFTIPSGGARTPARSADPARALFDSYQSLERTFDPAMADLYCETALIRTTRIFPSGERRTLEFPAPQYKALIRSLMPVARARNEYSTFTAVKFLPQGSNVRVTATRYSELKKYSSPHSVLIGACDSGAWGILEEISETRP